MSVAHTVATKQTRREAIAGRFTKKIPPADRVILRARTVSPVEESTLQRKKNTCSCGGSCPRCLSAQGIQPRLKIGAPDDKYEKEADQVADQVMRMPDPKIRRQAEFEDEEEELVRTKPVGYLPQSLIQRQAEPEEEPIQTNPLSNATSAMLQRQIEEEEEEEIIQTKPLADQITPMINRQVDEEEEEELQAKAKAAGRRSIEPGIESRISDLKGGGRPLDASTRAFFEPRFGHDFSHVRVHTGSSAAEAARSVNARAFTLGQNVVMGSGEYHPKSDSGQRLLAHELTHVVQQSGSGEIETTPGSLKLTQLNRIALQRRVINTHVSCRNTGLHGGVPGGILTGAQAIAMLQAAVSEAIRQGRRAENLLSFQILTFGTALYVADPTLDAALLNRFGLRITNPADHATIATIEREYKAVCDYLASGVPHYTCRGGACAAGDWAYALVPGNRLYMCNPFWNSGSVVHQGNTILHEAFHLWWSQVNDAGPSLHNAHCFDQFALDLAGVPVLPAFVGAC